VAQFKSGDFSTCDAPQHGHPKTVIPLRHYSTNSQAKLGRPPNLVKLIAEQLGNFM
jgi:hypothetical protein